MGLTILVGLLFTNQLFAQSSPSPGNDTFAFQPSGRVPDVTTTVTSKEVNSVDGTVQLDVTFNIPESVILKPNVTIYSQRPDTGGSNYFTLSQNPLDSTIDSDTFSTQFTFSYDQNNLPYYAKELVIKGRYHEPGDTTSTGTFEANARLYFTPYNTLEVWNLKDFHSLERIWLHPQEGQNPQRQYIHPDSIPESTIITDTANINHEWQKEWDYVFMEGLGYAIPMKKDQQPTCINEETCVQSKRDDCGLSRQRYHYQVQGNIEEILRNDLGQWFSLPYSRLQIKFYENDVLPNLHTNIDDQYLGSTTTDADGNFNFGFNICQSRITDAEIEVYLVIRAYNPNWEIKGRSLHTDINRGNAPLVVNRAVVQPEELENLGRSPDETAINGVNIDRWSGLHRSVVYASNAMNFVEKNLNKSHNELQDPINIFRNPFEGNFFYPGSLLNGNLPTHPFKSVMKGDNSFIVLDDNNIGNENTTYHEMGHYLMWKLQDKNWIDPLTASFSEWGWIGEHNPRITWTEGWAEAFGFMCDLRYFRIDQECQWEDNSNLESKEINNTPITNFQVGFQNPASVAAAIYDLYDGQQTYNNQNIPQNGLFRFDDNFTQSWNNGNFGQDDVELTLQEICQPLIDNAGLSDKLHDIDDYFRALMRNASCTERRDIKRVFDANEVVNDRNNPDLTGLSSDMIGRNVTHDVDVINTNIFGTEVDWDYVEDFFIDGQANTQLTFHAGVLNAGSISRYSGFLIDDLVLENNEFLRVNNHNLRLGNSPFDFVRNTGFGLFTPPLNSHYILNLCQGMQIEASDGGSIRIGTENNGNSSADVYLQEEGQTYAWG